LTAVPLPFRPPAWSASRTIPPRDAPDRFRGVDFSGAAFGGFMDRDDLPLGATAVVLILVAALLLLSS
jgi:hypothetical protein